MVPTDEDIVCIYLNGEEDALNLLIQRYIKSVYNFIYRYTKSSEVAEDITQDVFVLVWKNIKKFDTTRSFKAWLFTIARNTSLNWVKKHKPIMFSDLQTDVEFDIADTSIEFQEDVFDSFLLHAHVKEAVKKLPLLYQNIISMKVDTNFTFQEMSEVLGESINTIKSKHRRAIQQLRQILGPIIKND
jgi:RNA polymerase sigma factor (sigma-70 family)